ncbi:MAG: PilZ domain-containing protein [Treponema sp.]|nr:PilZ domain-containing protein [Treponema sp.]
MNSKERLSQRFEDMGRFFAEDICALPGILENISREGCKIRYQFPVTVDMDCDYDVKITFARAASDSFVLVCHPQWIHEEGNYTEIGFRILPSTDYTRLASYINQLEEESTADDIDIQLSDSVCQIIK